MLSDSFNFRARVLPFLIATAPVVAWVVLALTSLPGLERLWGAGLPAAVLALAAHFARDAGRSVEQKLWASWGGPPSTRLLRWRNSNNDVHHERLHQRLQSVLGHTPALPTRSEEQADPAHADHVYETAARVLIARTNDRTQFHQLKEELISYNFRRNLHGLRWMGVITGALGAAAAALVFYLPPGVDGVRCLALGGFSAFIALLHVFHFSASWVKKSADCYARELIKCVETLAAP